LLILSLEKRISGFISATPSTSSKYSAFFLGVGSQEPRRDETLAPTLNDADRPVNEKQELKINQGYERRGKPWTLPQGPTRGSGMLRLIMGGGEPGGTSLQAKSKGDSKGKRGRDRLSSQKKEEKVSVPHTRRFV
jgi:hypothetical protein